MISKKCNLDIQKNFDAELDYFIHLFYKKLNKNNWNIPLISRQKLLSEAKNKKINAQVCHIIGSGSSLNQSKHLIKKNELVIGFNYAALSGLDFDIYFFECGGNAVIEDSENHISIAKEILFKKTELIFFKNLWEDKNDLNYIKEKWIGLAQPIEDIHYPTLSYETIPYTIKRCFEASNNFLPQYKSSVITSIFLAYQIGIKKIVLHGVDFGGRYFFEEDNSISLKHLHLIPKKLTNKNNLGKKQKTVHDTDKGENRMQAIIPIISEYLQSKNFALYSAVSDSPASKLLPVYITK